MVLCRIWSIIVFVWVWGVCFGGGWGWCLVSVLFGRWYWL